MTDHKIHCPECNAEFPLSESIAAEHIAAEQARLKSTYDRKAEGLAEREARLKQAEQQIKTDVAAERESLLKTIEQDVRKEMQSQIAATEKRLVEKDERLQQAEASELKSRKHLADADEKTRRASLEAQRKFDEDRKAIIEASAKNEEALKKALVERDAALAGAKKHADERFEAERDKLTVKARAEAKSDMDLRLKDAEKRIAEKDERVKAAEATELASRKLIAEAEDKLRSSELEVQRQVDAAKTGIREQALKEAGEDKQRSIAEKDKHIEQMTTQIETLKRKSESRSQQLQGDLEEENVYGQLRDAFPSDEIVRTKRGRNGADIELRVKSPSGKVAGTVLIEVKDTQNYDNKWAGKLKEDMQLHSANLGVIVSRAMPNDIEAFDQRDGVWVCRIEVLVALLAALRSEVLHVFRVRGAIALTESKRDVVFGYFTGAEFSGRITTTVDGYNAMRTSIDKQKKQFNRSMSEQERALDKVIAGLSGMYGDLTYLTGAALKPVAGLDVEEPSEDQPALTQGADTPVIESGAA